jgi:hypothetical protein
LAGILLYAICIFHVLQGAKTIYTDAFVAAGSMNRRLMSVAVKACWSWLPIVIARDVFWLASRYAGLATQRPACQ